MKKALLVTTGVLLYTFLVKNPAYSKPCEQKDLVGISWIRQRMLTHTVWRFNKDSTITCTGTCDRTSGPPIAWEYFGDSPNYIKLVFQKGTEIFESCSIIGPTLTIGHGESGMFFIKVGN